MNLGEIKAFVGDKSVQSTPDQQLKQQLREIGLRQASSSLGNHVSLSTSVVSSQTTVGLRVYNNSLNQTLSINQKNANLPIPEQKEKSLFDFEEVAKNVLRFVGGAIKQAASKGADEDTLLKLFEQARSGVQKGIELAEKDLEGFINDDIEEGISRSRDLIGQGIQTLQDELFGNRREQESSIGISTQESLGYSRTEFGDLNIRTRDGDDVTIRFEDLKQFEFNRQSLIEVGYTQPVVPEPEITNAGASNVNNSTETDVAEPETDSDSQRSPAASAPPVQIKQSAQENALFFERSNFSYSVQGELDENELEAIGNLVSDANELAKTFFEGDIETAFKQALEIGYDEQELAGFALQLTRQEQVHVVQAYEAVSHFNDNASSLADPVTAVRPISQYLDKALSVLEQSQQNLQDRSAYEDLINGIVNQIEGIDTKDLLSAINQFHSFNKQLIDSLPGVQE